MDTKQTIADIKAMHDHWQTFWGDGGWASGDAAELLAASRLDWLCSLAGCLTLWIDADDADGESGRLILAWANLGALIEGDLLFFLAVWKESVDGSALTRKERRAAARLEKWSLQALRLFYEEHVWCTAEDHRWNDWLQKIQGRRNSIHAFRNRHIGTLKEFEEELGIYLKFIVRLETSIPYPEEKYGYPDWIHNICWSDGA